MLLASGFALSIFSAPSLKAEANSSVDRQVTNSVGQLAGRNGPVRASARLKAGLDALDKRQFSKALKIRSQMRGGTLERKVLAWAIAMRGDDSGLSAENLISIANDLNDWPSALSMRRNAEKVLAKSGNDSQLRQAFRQTAPVDTDAAISVARAHLRAGDKKSARRVIAPVWRETTLSRSQEATIAQHLGAVLQRDDHRARVEHLLSRDRLRGAQRIAGSAGMTRLIAARVAVERKTRDAGRLLAAVPASQKNHPNYLQSKAMHERQAGKLRSAAKTLLSIDTRSVIAAAGDSLWVEQRILASDLLDKGDAKTAYRLASRNVATSTRRKLDAEFYAGWLALQKLGRAKTALQHFERLTALAGTPVSKARGLYWTGRALAKDNQKTAAVAKYEQAARHDTTFYGQMAALTLGRKSLSISRPRPTAQDRALFEKYELVQAIMKLESAGHPRKARPFYRHLAGRMQTPGELALLAARAEKRGDYQLSLQVGKTAFTRDFDADTLAWPIGAIPRNTRTSGAGLPLAYAIARQESTFQIDARSPANALGLLQLLPGTAKATARSLGMRYSRSRLTSDASYNARLGTAYLAEQMKRFGGSYVLTFVAYNAGPRRAAEWVERYGDPRGQSLESVIDWIEQIPYRETRGYVQRVMENYQIYKARLSGSKLNIGRDLRAGRR
ncbi:MAG: lytic transglycosylase domain-containing protein [Pseudomonadota bacterium]